MKLTTPELQNKLELVRARVPERSVWTHFKGGVYVVTGHAIGTDPLLHTVILYERIGGPGFDPRAERGLVFARPLSEWFEIVETKEDGSSMYISRFNLTR